jgi:hypothetical protein
LGVGFPLARVEDFTCFGVELSGAFAVGVFYLADVFCSIAVEHGSLAGEPAVDEVTLVS